MLRTTEAPSVRILDSHVVAVMRLVLSSWALLAILIDVIGRTRIEGPVEYVVLGLYTIYSAVVFLWTWTRRTARDRPFDGWAHWADVCWYGILLWFSGANSIFFLGFLFPILVASFRWGFAEGLRVAIVSSIIFSAIGLGAALQGTLLELGRFLLRPIYLLVLGYMMAFWGGFELNLKRQLALLKDVSTLSNPRFGVDHTVCSLIKRLREFYGAATCLLLISDPSTKKHWLYRDQSAMTTANCGEPVEEGLVNLLLAVPKHQAMVFNARTSLSGYRRRSRHYAWDTVQAAEVPPSGEVASVMAETLDAASFASVPLIGGGMTGRLYLTSGKHIFESSDLHFLIQVVRNIMPVIQNIRLVDQLAFNASEEERLRIARDLHDSIIQPYIGLQMAVAALGRKLESGSGSEEITEDVQHLDELTGEAISNLRRYVRGLRSPGSSSEGSLLSAVRRFAARYSQATNISVDVDASGDLAVTDRLSAQVFPMVAEGLSNIRRHTTAEHARIKLARLDGQLMLRIENDCPEKSNPAHFTPRSISERAAALGGSAQVEQTPSGNTSIVISIPM